jgi:ribosomal-protein-alanine N-acetyltransferase
MIIKEIEEKNIKNLQKNEWSKLDNKYFRAPLKIDKFYFGAFENRKIVGYMEIIIIGGVGHLSDLMVKENYRKKGIGSLLLKKFETFCKSKKCHKLTINVPENFKDTIRFYKQHGYKKEVVFKNYRFHLNWFVLSKSISIHSRN